MLLKSRNFNLQKIRIFANTQNFGQGTMYLVHLASRFTSGESPVKIRLQVSVILIKKLIFWSNMEILVKIETNLRVKIIRFYY